MRIANNCIVSLSFTLTNQQGVVLDQRTADQPLEYLHGAAGILPALEEELTGRSVGEDFRITIPPERGFGLHEPQLLEMLPLASWPQPEQLTVGHEVESTDDQGNVVRYVIVGRDEETVTLDANHPMAGMTLHFAGSVLGVRAATEEELAAVRDSSL